jgi:hypothetical protein
MVLTKILLVLAALIGGLVLLQNQHAFERAGLIGGCEQVNAPLADVRGTQWWSCREGMLTGYPSLVKDNCELKLRTTGRQTWRCPTPIERPAALI